MAIIYPPSPLQPDCDWFTVNEQLKGHSLVNLDPLSKSIPIRPAQ